MCCFPVHPGRETPKSNPFAIFRERSAFWSLEIKEMRCKTSCGCLGLRNICLLFVLHFTVNTAFLSPSYSLSVCCYCLNNNQQILMGISFILREECEAKFPSLSKGLWSPPQMKVPVKHNIVFSLGQGKKWGYLQLRQNPAARKRRRNTTTEERLYTQVCKEIIQFYSSLFSSKWNKSMWFSSFWVSIFLHSAFMSHDV